MVLQGTFEATLAIAAVLSAQRQSRVKAGTGAGSRLACAIFIPIIRMTFIIPRFNLFTLFCFMFRTAKGAHDSCLPKHILWFLQSKSVVPMSRCSSRINDCTSVNRCSEKNKKGNSGSRWLKSLHGRVDKYHAPTNSVLHRRIVVKGFVSG